MVGVVVIIIVVLLVVVPFRQTGLPSSCRETPRTRPTSGTAANATQYLHSPRYSPTYAALFCTSKTESGQRACTPDIPGESHWCPQDNWSRAAGSATRRTDSRSTTRWSCCSIHRLGRTLWPKQSPPHPGRARSRSILPRSLVANSGQCPTQGRTGEFPAGKGKWSRESRKHLSKKLSLNLAHQHLQ